jgi:transcriptional repressor NrdR
MRCPFCGNEDTQVKDSRPTEDSAAIRRRRQCQSCGARFTTFERVQLRELAVVKRDGEKQSFDREKLTRSMALALQKRVHNEEDINRIVSSIIRQLESSGDTDISSKDIGEMVMLQLSEIDPVAYVRYASVYKDFKEVKDFNQFIEEIRPVSEAD